MLLSLLLTAPSLVRRQGLATVSQRVAEAAERVASKWLRSADAVVAAYNREAQAMNSTSSPSASGRE